MASARPLRDVFNELAGSGSADDSHADEILAVHGHPGLPDGLVAEAVVNYADTAPVEVAEHLAPFVIAHSAVQPPAGDAGGWLDALATAPEPIAELDPEPIAELDPEPPLGASPLTDAAYDIDPADLDFGVGDAGAGQDLAGADWSAAAPVVEAATLDEFTPVEPPAGRDATLGGADAGGTTMDDDDLDDAGGIDLI